MKRDSRVMSACMLLLAGLLPAVSALADDYPSRPIQFIVSTAAGGAVDTFARVVGDQLSSSLKQPVVVIDKPGANGVIATEYVATSKPDGYTLLVTYEAHTVNPYLMKNVPYNARTSFIPVTLLATNPMVLVVNKSVPATSLAELVALAKQKPGKLNAAQFGSSMLVPLKLLNARADVDIVPIAYKERSAATTDLLEGRIDMMFVSVVSIAQHIKNGSVRALAVTTPERSPALPDVPTVQEAGIPGYDFRAWNGILAPAGTPDAVIRKLQTEIVKALQVPSVQQRLSEQAKIVGSSSSEFAKVIDDELALWAKMNLN